jgi:hypothetical protein
MIKMLEPMDIYARTGYHMAEKQKLHTPRDGKNKHRSPHKNKIGPEISAN